MTDYVLTAEDVKTLRDKTSASMADAKRALEKAAGDIYLAQGILKYHGCAIHVKNMSHDEWVMSHALDWADELREKDFPNFAAPEECDPTDHMAVWEAVNGNDYFVSREGVVWLREAASKMTPILDRLFEDCDMDVPYDWEFVPWAIVTLFDPQCEPKFVYVEMRNRAREWFGAQ